MPQLLRKSVTPLLLVLSLTSMLYSPILKATTEEKPEQDRIEFNRDIRPILSEKCLHCHGPDPATREADLRLDDPTDVRRPRDDYSIINLKQPVNSELLKRLLTSDTDLKMPPADSGKEIFPQEIKLIQRWIEQGAEYQQHWSFIPPGRPELPAVKDQSWTQSPIDRFVLARLEREGLKPSPRAEKATLCRRLSFDLTGLPPTLAELDAFLNDDSPHAYEKLIDRLLASPHYGEHRARYWLDAARYADTSGYFTDDEWQMWRWRDWVINAFNDNKPFDQFTIEQLAGDLLPNPTQDQLIATGFNRNHMTTQETGIIDEEYRVEYVVDRLDATSTVWMGLTMGCARCHDHKYDPISQKEFYQLFAFFNNSPETGNTGTAGNAKPILKIPSDMYLAQEQQLKDQVATLEQQHKQREQDLTKQQAEWEIRVLKGLKPPSNDQLILHYPLDDFTQNNTLKLVGDPESVSGFIGQGVKFDGTTLLESSTPLALDRNTPFTIAAWINPASGGPACLLSKNDDRSQLRGFDIMLRKGKLAVHLIHKWNINAIQVVTDNKLKTGRWQHLLVTYDGSSTAAGVRIYFNGTPQATSAPFDSLTDSITTQEPFRIGRRSTSAFYKGSIDDIRIFQRTLSPEEARQLADYQFLSTTLSVPTEKRTNQQQQALRNYFLNTAAPKRFQTAERDLQSMRSKLAAHQKNIPTSMIMQENETSRDTFILLRGVYNKQGEKVTASVPAALPSFTNELPTNRLGLARWLTSPEHPLTARVYVNRLWQQIFGVGLVKTVGDFGSQGEWPSHPELLDWLAVEFQESGWDIKHLIKQIVLSATYQQSSRVTDELYERDPENRLLARGPRFRLDAETVRDNALQISGLLIAKQGGPSVKPYQPAGLWEAVSYDGDVTYQQDTGDGLYRRSLYTYWKRQSPPPGLMAFDAPTRETCTVNRPRTNTPLQALVLMNDPTYLEAARILAEQTLKKHSTELKRIQFAFRSATSRMPNKFEQSVLHQILTQQLNVYQNSPAVARKLLQVGETRVDKTISPAELAAWTIVTNTIFNMDETVTKQ
ncbi:DUF1553 domain-containing protein [uncultured Gimesia sp.]|uniref:DUF1553 domain-containing protein n=1 Tax=uncultured Gimesia sp. TaxID=1678688 RepID=UPI0030D8CF45|tara:strand:- start:1595 stop:4756 length:3162 start_codon:yes stop_codon:yes gene_type:complete